MAGQASPRYHALDALRAAMMLLGLVLHGAASYTTQPIGAGWPYQDARTHVFADLAAFYVHVFRMPAFFVASGFFAALLFERDGVRGFLRNRALRLLAPLAIFVPLLLPLVAGGFGFAQYRATGALDTTALDERPPLLEAPLLMHLWFLYHLAILCAAAAAVASWLPASWGDRVRSTTRVLAAPGAGLMLMAAVTWLTLLPMQVPAIDTSGALLPPLRILIAYGVFFGFGWVLYWHRDRLDGFARHWLRGLVLGVLAATSSMALLIAQPFEVERSTFMAATALRSLSAWMFAVGWLGLFVRYLGTPRPVVRYLADASYWMYLLHLPVIIWMAGVIAPWSAPAIIKFVVVFVVATAVTLASYEVAVRSTAIGRLLNGRRYPRGLPRPEPPDHFRSPRRQP